MQPMGKRSTTIFFAALSLVATMLPAASEPMRPLREITQTMERCYAALVKFQTESETNGLTKAPVDWKDTFLGCMRAYGFKQLAGCPHDPRLSASCYQQTPIPNDEVAIIIRELVEK
jgi:hypothetical protein